MVLLTDANIFAGTTTATALTHGSHRLKRVCSSSLSVEALGLQESIKQGDYLRAMILEALDAKFDVSHYEKSLEKIKMVWVTDCRSVYDHLKFDRGLPRDKRLAIELAALKEDLKRANNEIRWMPGRKLIVDALTKQIASPDLLMEFLNTGQYAIVDTTEEQDYRANIREAERQRKNAKQNGKGS